MNATQFRPLVYAVLMAAVGAFIVLLVWVLFSVNQATNQINDSTDEIRQTQVQTKALLKAVRDCTDTNGTCYRQQRATAAAQRGAINATTIAAAFCTVQGHGDTYRHLLACVDHQLNGKAKP